MHFYVCQTIRNRPRTLESLRQSLTIRAHACTDSRRREFRAILANRDLIDSNKSTVMKMGKCAVFRQLYVKHYTVKALIAECIISIKPQSHSFPNIRLCETLGCDVSNSLLTQGKNEARMKLLNRNTRQNRELYKQKGRNDT